MPRRLPGKSAFYDKADNPLPDFNRHMVAWLSGQATYTRASPKAFEKLLALYRRGVETALSVTGESVPARWQAHRSALSRLEATGSQVACPSPNRTHATLMPDATLAVSG